MSIAPVIAMRLMPPVPNAGSSVPLVRNRLTTMSASPAANSEYPAVTILPSDCSATPIDAWCVVEVPTVDTFLPVPLNVRSGAPAVVKRATARLPDPAAVPTTTMRWSPGWTATAYPVSMPPPIGAMATPLAPNAGSSVPSVRIRITAKSSLLAPTAVPTTRTLPSAWTAMPRARSTPADADCTTMPVPPNVVLNGPDGGMCMAPPMPSDWRRCSAAVSLLEPNEIVQSEVVTATVSGRTVPNPVLPAAGRHPPAAIVVALRIANVTVTFDDAACDPPVDATSVAASTAPHASTRRAGASVRTRAMGVVGRRAMQKHRAAVEQT